MKKGISRNFIKVFVFGFIMLTLICTDSKIIKATTLQTGSVDSEGNNADQNNYTIAGKDGKLIGRYALNYTGNINWSVGWLVGANNGEPGGYMENKVYNDLSFSQYKNWSTYQKGVTQYYTADRYGRSEISSFNSVQIQPNSSKATLTKSTDDAKIVAAYLIWYTRDSGGLFGYYDDPVYFVAPSGQEGWVYPEHACTDTRYGIDSYLCMSADVTSIVTEEGAGYGTYGVANIPYWYQTNGTVAGATGGSCYGGWQLVIVEESADYPVRTVKIDIGSTYANTGYTGTLTLKNGLMTSPTSAASGQVFFTGFLADKYLTDGNRYSIYNTIYSNTMPEPLSGSKIYANVFLKNGTELPVHDSGSGDSYGGFAQLETFRNVGNNATMVTVQSAGHKSWDSYNCLGMAVDIAFPTLEGQQKTTVNSDNSVVTVTGGYHNVTEDSDTGIGGGELVVTLDDELTAKSSTLTLTYADGTTKTVTGTYNNADKTVTFQGVELVNKGDSCSYTIACSITGKDDEEFHNKDTLSGYLYSNGVRITGYPVEEASSSYSSLYLIVKVSLDPQGSAIDGGTVKSAGTSCYYEYYNVGNYADKAHRTKITRITIPTKTGCVFAGYYTGKNGTGKQYVRADGTITSTATTFTEDTTLYAKWEPGVYKITLDGINPTTQGTACYYEKYTVGNFADEACTTKITRITLPAKRGCTFDGYWTKKGGDSGGGSICVTTAGAICTRADQFMQDTTIYANWNPNTYTITCDNQGATTPGSACFYELYNVKFFYDTVVTTSGTAQIPFDYTGGVQYFTAPYTGTYTLDVYGAQGGNATYRGAFSTGGLGGYSYGDIYLSQGETIYIYIGGMGNSVIDTSEAVNSYGYNGGGSAHPEQGADWNRGGGGGATDIRKDGTALENRIIVAGGGGGGAVYSPISTSVATGGNGGGLDFQPVYSVNYVTNSGTNSVILNTRAPVTYGSLGVGASGAGGGYYGGGDYVYNCYVSAGEGGTGYVGGVSNGGSAAGVRSGNGYAVITRSNYTTQRYDTTKIDVPTKQGYYFRGYFTGTNGTGTAITDAKGKILVDPDYFANNTTVYAYWSAVPEQTYTIVYNGNGATGGSMASVSVPVDADYRLNTNLFTRENYTFAGWSTSPAGGAAYQNNATVRNLTTPGNTITLYAVWKANTYTIRFHGNGETGGSMEDMRCDYGKNYRLTKNSFEKTGYHFVKWTTNQDGTGDAYSDGQTVNSLKANAQGIVHLYAQWDANEYTIHFDPNGGGEVAPIPDITVRYDGELAFPDASGAYVKYTLDGVNVTQKVLDGDIILDDTGVVVMMLDEETGNFMTPDGAVVNEDGSMSRGNGDGTVTAGETENTGTTESETEEEQTEMPGDSAETGNSGTASVEQNAVNRTATAADDTDVDQELQETGDTGTDTADAPAAQAETEEEADAEPQPDKKAYASVFMGWCLADDKDGFIPQWTAGTVLDIATLVEAAGVTDQNGATITLYAVWDDGPWIQAVNLYYTLEQAQSGFITQEEILSHATASDREDGSPIAPGFHENGTSFSIPDYAPTDFTQFQHEGSCTENLTVVDSAGSVYSKMITVYVVDTTPVTVKPEGTTRFINEYYYNQPYENGGLEENSIWKTDPEYVAALETAFENSRNDTPILTYTFTHEEILEMREYVREHGIGNSKEEDALENFYDLFMAPNLVE